LSRFYLSIIFGGIAASHGSPNLAYYERRTWRYVVRSKDGISLSNESTVNKRPFLLSTKLFIPKPHTELVSRPQLTKRLDICQDCPLTIVSAPAGFGKTTLVAEWVQEAKSTKNKFVWVSLDQTDNDPIRFLTYFIAGLQKVETSIGEAALDWLQSATESPAEAVLAEAINDIVALPFDIILIFDDFHLITEPAIHQAFVFLLDNQPSNLHLVIISRADPPWPLARLRARRQLNEVRAKDLRFSVAETAVFLNDAMQLNLTPEEVIVLDNRTEGWVAGLQMAALSMRGRNDKTSFIKSFTGSHRFILDYLMEEVLEQQTPDIQEFLLKTSILGRMNASLCDAVLNRSNSQSVLVQLEQENMFLIALDDERHWYRYHHLFADLLHDRLLQTFPRQVADLHRQAGWWYEENGRLNESVRHALLASDLEQVAHLIGKNALAMAYHGELKTLVGWLEELPANMVQSKPQLFIAYAWALGFSGRLQDGEAWLKKAEDALSTSSSGPKDHQNQHLSGQIAAARTYIAGFGDDIPRITDMAREALDGLPKEDLLTRALTATILGLSLRRGGEYEVSGKAFDEAVTLSQAAGDTHLLVDALWERSLLEFAQGKLNKVMETCQTARRFAEDYKNRSGRRLPIMGYMYERMGAVLLEWNNLEAAEHHAREGVALCQKWGSADALVNSSFCLARVYLAKGALDEALNVMKGISHLVSGLGTWHSLTAQAIEAQIRFLQGDVTAVARWVKAAGLSPGDEVNLDYISLYTTLTRHLITENQPHEALNLLSRLLSIAETSGGIGIVVRVLALQATALQIAGELVAAQAALERALSLAKPEGYVRTFVSEGIPIYELLKQIAAQGTNRAYASKLLAAFPAEVKQQTPVTAVPTTTSPLIDPLSQRELDVLRLLNTHLSGTEIAGELFIAPSTVRSHIKNIYGKLNVHSRTEAVVRAEELNLL
jgi:LuxR family maltose regulon positive regulatory protein